MGLKCHLDTGKQKFLMSLYFDKNAQTPQNDTVNSWRVNVLCTPLDEAMPITLVKCIETNYLSEK